MATECASSEKLTAESVRNAAFEGDFDTALLRYRAQEVAAETATLRDQLVMTSKLCDDAMVARSIAEDEASALRVELAGLKAEPRWAVTTIETAVRQLAPACYFSTTDLERILVAGNPHEKTG